MFLVLGRTIRESFRNFWRNGWLSVAAVSVMIFSLFTISVLFVITETGSNILRNVQERVNVSIYFKSDVSEENISKAKIDLESYSEVASVEYVSKEKALEDFKSNNVNEPAIVKSLEELGENPLLASLVVKAKSPDQYESVSAYLAEASFKEDISRVNYGKNKEIIEKLNRIVAEIKKIGSILAVLLAGISILIIFNTIRITIYTHRQEIEVMRLVGASNTFIRLPFIFEGIIYGAIASVISMGLLFLSVRFTAQYFPSVVLPENLFSFYLKNFALLLGMQLAIGTFLGIFSSIIAMRKYLRI
ncbi:MAG: Cell division protein FtsX [Patescibacteria group bacterium]|nr:Cell division protein FtsX [Patescibacteria group bacterium]